MGIFARVLKQVLIAHEDDDLSRLGGVAARTDPIWYPLRRLAINPAVIARLKEAAEADDKHATLSPDDLEYLMEQLHLSPQERAHLRAALMAQGVESLVQARLASAGSPTDTSVAATVYAQLLEHYDPNYDRVRGSLSEETSSASTAPGLYDDLLALLSEANTALLNSVVAIAAGDAGTTAAWLARAVDLHERIGRLAAECVPEVATAASAASTALRHAWQASA